MSSLNSEKIEESFLLSCRELLRPFDATGTDPLETMFQNFWNFSLRREF